MSARPTAEVSPLERRYENGEAAAVLDVAEIPMLEPAPRLHQTENHVIDARRRWRRRGRLTWLDLPGLVDHPATLWGLGESTRDGFHDRITREAALNFGMSLWLIKPSNVQLHVSTRGEIFEKPKRVIRASFRNGFVKYNLPVTDPAVERAFRRKSDSTYPVEDDVYFCVSLTEPHVSGYCYKLVATIFHEQPLVRE